MISLILAAQLLATAPQTTTAAPVVCANTGQTRTLADVARERKLGKKGVQGGTLSVAGSSTPGASTAVQIGNIETQINDTKAVTEATKRMTRAIEHGSWVDRNIHYNENIRQDARSEWDAAAESCRRTPGCIPTYRDGVIFDTKPLMTGDEILRAGTSKQDSVEPLGR